MFFIEIWNKFRDCGCSHTVTFSSNKLLSVHFPALSFPALSANDKELLCFLISCLVIGQTNVYTLFQNSLLFKYSFVFIQISPWCLVLKLKIQKNILSWTRQQGPICIRINQRPFWNKVYGVILPLRPDCLAWKLNLWLLRSLAMKKHLVKFPW